MSERSAHLDLPYIQPAQAQKHVTHNEALRKLDALVQLSVADRDRTAPPAAPQPTDRHIVASNATGAWAGKDHAIAVYEETGGWAFYAPQAGWQALVLAETAQVFWSGADWAAVSVGEDLFQNVDMLGVNITADPTNRLATAGDATLLTHVGTDHRLKINKAADTDTASLLFQSDWMGHAEMGLTGGIDFTLRVSPDGATFTDALSADATTGELTAPAGINFGQSKLTHYEEGTWTPRLTFGGSDTGITYDENSGVYLRVGNMVMLQCAIDLSARGTATGDAMIHDLPFDANPLYYPGELFFIGGASQLNAPKCRALPGRRITLLNSGSQGTSSLTHANFTDLTNLKLTLMHLL